MAFLRKGIASMALPFKSRLVFTVCVAALLAATPLTSAAQPGVDDAIDATLEQMERGLTDLQRPQIATLPTDKDLKEMLERNGVRYEDLQRTVREARAQALPLLGLAPESANGKAARSGGEQPDSQLRLFVSFDMPKASLERLVQDARLSGGVLVLRGMRNNRLKDTYSAIRGLKDGEKAAWQISSHEFREYNIEVVPTTMVRMGPHEVTKCRANQDASCIEQQWYAVEGDVSIEYALEKMKVASPEVTREANVYLARLRPGAEPNGLPTGGQ